MSQLYKLYQAYHVSWPQVKTLKQEYNNKIRCSSKHLQSSLLKWHNLYMVATLIQSNYQILCNLPFQDFFFFQDYASKH